MASYLSENRRTYLDMAVALKVAVYALFTTPESNTKHDDIRCVADRIHNICD